MLKLLSGLGQLLEFQREPCRLNGYSIVESNIWVSHGFIKHKIKTTDNLPIEQIKVNTQVYRSLVVGLVDTDVEDEEVEADLEEV